MPADPFEMRLRVASGDIDELGHASNIVYLRWVQDAAAAHWLALAPPDARTAVAWVVLRHEIDYKVAALLDDELRLRTWVGLATGMTFERHTAIHRLADDRLLALARTLWCPIDPRTGRPTRVTPQLRALFSSSSTH